MRRLLLFIMESYIYRIFLRYILPFLRWPKGIPEEKREIIRQQVMPGDIILTKTKRSLAAQLIPGDWDHALIFTMKDRTHHIAEMIAPGFNEDTLEYVLNDCDQLCILRPKDQWPPVYIIKFLKKALSFKGAKYDQSFDLGIKSLYCSELIYHADIDKRLKFNLEDLAGLGRPYLSPMGIYNCVDLEKIYVS